MDVDSVRRLKGSVQSARINMALDIQPSLMRNVVAVHYPALRKDICPAAAQISVCFHQLLNFAQMGIYAARIDEHQMSFCARLLQCLYRTFRNPARLFRQEGSVNIIK